MNRIHVYYRTPPEQKRWFYGDQYLIPILRTLIRGKKIGGIKKVFVSLCKGFDLLKVDYTINQSFKNIKPNEPVIVLGNGSFALQDYHQPNPIIAGIGLMTHPEQWPDLFKQFPVATYLQHSTWTRNIYTPYFGRNNCALWPAGIDTERWNPSKKTKKYDLLIYNKIMWNKQQTNALLKLPILQKLQKAGLSFTEITYGHYSEKQYYRLLQQSKAMIFLCEHESQGFAYLEALAMNVPVLAWDQGFWLDPNRFSWNEKQPVQATSVPYFDGNCGEKFTDLSSFYPVFDSFYQNVLQGTYAPRNYILQNLTLKISAQKMLDIVKNIYK